MSALFIKMGLSVLVRDMGNGRVGLSAHHGSLVHESQAVRLWTALPLAPS